MKKEFICSLSLLLAAIIWGVAFVALGIGTEFVGHFTFLMARSWIAFFMMLVLFIIMEKRRKMKGKASCLPQSKADWRYCAFGGITCGVFLFTASWTQQMGIALTISAKAGFITAMYVVIVPVMSFIFGQKVTVRVWISVALGVVGLYLLSMQGGISLEKGDSLVLICAFLFSFHIMSVNHFAPNMDGVFLSMLQFLTVAILGTINMLLFEKPTVEGIKMASWAIFYTGCLSSGVGFTLQIMGQKGLSPSLASLIMSLESVFAALAGWLIMHETLTLRESVGCVVMFGAIILSQLPDRD